MHFLPIVVRELRSAMRRKSTVRWRLLSVAFTTVVAGLFLAVGQFNFSPGIGQTLFNLLTGYTAIICFFSGPFLTANCISDERRDGTLGLLFLGSLKGYDVVLGKFISQSLNVLYGILAVQPIMAIPMIIGGVSVGEFWRVSLAILNILFFSLALGILVSAASVDSEKPAMRTSWLLLLFCLVFPLGAGVANGLGLVRLDAVLELASPTTALRHGYGALSLLNPALYWKPLLSTHLLEWFFLVLASIWLPRNWTDTPVVPKRGFFRALRGKPSQTEHTGRARKRARFLDANPIYWLAGDAPGMMGAVWILVAIALTVSLFAAIVAYQILPQTIAGVMLPIQVLIGILVAMHSTRFFIDARRSGILEVLLSTPLTSREIVRGQWKAIMRIFLWPVLILLMLQLGGFFLGMFVGEPLSLASIYSILIGPAIVLTPGFFIPHLLAIAELGMCLAANLGNPQRSTRLTILFVLLILPFRLVCCIPTFVIDVVVIIIARKRVYRALRPPMGIIPLPLPHPPPPPLMPRPPKIPPPLPL